MINKSLVKDKADSFALRIIKLYNYLKDTHKEFVISKQILRSGTSIGSNITESKFAQSTADFISKHQIALKEAAETEYWLDLLYKSEYIEERLYKSLFEDNEELIRMLSAIVISNKEKLKEEEKKKNSKGRKTNNS